MKPRRSTHIVVAVFAMLLLASASAFAAKAPPAVQTPLSPTKIPQFAQPLNVLGVGLPLATGTNITVNICEFQTNILPPGTPVAGALPGVAPLTWTWGYQVDPAGGATVCNPNPGHSYLGPVVVAGRGTPTQLTMVNKLPNANVANVKAYTTSTDQTLIWGDPLGLDALPPPITFGVPELNMCWNAAQALVPPALMPVACLNNYGFLGPQTAPPAAPPLTYGAPTPAAVHIHGGEVPSVLDGGPDSWWTGNGIYGHGFYTRHVKSLPGLLAAQPALPASVAGLPVMPATVAGLPALPDSVNFPVGTLVFDGVSTAYFVNAVDPVTLLETWTPTAVAYPLLTVVFDATPITGGYFQNVANVWTAATVANPIGAVIQVVGLVYENLANAWATSVITPYSEGTLVFNEADNLNYQVAAGAWVLQNVIDRASYVYPNGQEAAPVWFHDHMLGATRLNVYAGIAGGYVITEPPSTLAAGLHPLGLSDATTGALTELTVPLIIQDRMFDTNGQLFFPNVGINPEHPFWIPEFVGDVIVVNGKAWPFFNVQPKRYKFLFLNGSNARAYELFLQSKTTGLKGPGIWVIGNDQGYLDSPQLINPNLKLNGKLTMMPGERYEVIVDFSTVAGQTLVLQNTARTPWMGGAPVNGTTTGRVMQFRVAPGVVVDNSFLPAAGKAIRPPMVRLTTAGGTTPAAGVTIHKTRRLTLNEVIAAGGPLEILVNNTLYDGSKPRPPYTDPVTGLNDFTPITSMSNTSYYSELPYEGETELWEIINTTADAHPMHPHLVAFQVLNRQPLDVLGYLAAYTATYLAAGLPLDGAGPPFNYNSSGNPACSTTAPVKGDPRYIGLVPQCVLGGNPDPAATLSLIGPAVPPAPQETGWKDTVQALPNMVTRILVRFAKPDLPVTTPAAAAGYDFSPNGGHGYVWHCHIVDHEDNEMMRPFSVVQNASFPHSYVMGLDY